MQTFIKSNSLIKKELFLDNCEEYIIIFTPEEDVRQYTIINSKYLKENAYRFTRYIDITNYPNKDNIMENYPDECISFEKKDGIYIQSNSIDEIKNNKEKLDGIKVKDNNIKLLPIYSKNDISKYDVEFTINCYETCDDKRKLKELLSELKQMKLVIMQPNDKYSDYNQYRECLTVESSFTEVLPNHDFFYDVTHCSDIADFFSDEIIKYSFEKNIEDGVAGYVLENPELKLSLKSYKK